MTAIDRTAAFPDTVAEILGRTARQVPSKTVLTFADREWTYVELDRATGSGSGPDCSNSDSAAVSALPCSARRSWSGRLGCGAGQTVASAFTAVS